MFNIEQSVINYINKIKDENNSGEDITFFIQSNTKTRTKEHRQIRERYVKTMIKKRKNEWNFQRIFAKIINKSKKDYNEDPLQTQANKTERT